MSSPVWLLSTRGRPKDCQATVDACMDAGMKSRGVVYIDETPYPKLKLPKNWSVHYEPEWRSLQGSLQWCYETYPDASHYGWLADDVRPRTRGWDRLLEDAAGEWGLSYARDLWFSEDPAEEERLEKGHNVSSGLCWAGRLVRAVGWWALPGVRQAGIDTAWTDIVRPLGLHRYTREVVVEHLNWRTGKRPKDDGDEWERDGTNYVYRDLMAKNEWAWSGAYRDVLARVARHAGVSLADYGVLKAARSSYVDERHMAPGGLPAARMLKIMEGELDANLFSVHTDTQPQAVDP